MGSINAAGGALVRLCRAMATIKTYDEYPFGLSWVIDEPMRRTSHALVADGRVWLVDPVDAGDALERAAALGEPAAVLQLLDRHNRDCAAVAERLGVLHVKVPDTIPGSPFLPSGAAAARLAGDRPLVAGAAGAGRGRDRGHRPALDGRQRAGGHAHLLRPLPPQILRGYEPEHLLVGHGSGVHGPTRRAGFRRPTARPRRPPRGGSRRSPAR